MISFEVGKKYESHFVGDSQLHAVYTVTKRSAKFVTLTDSTGATRRKGLEPFFLAEGVEVVLEHGEYISARDLIA